MKKIYLLALILSVGILSCNKNEQLEQLHENQNKFVEPQNPDEINQRVKSFMNSLNQQERTFLLGQVNYSLEESIWLIEASLNYSYDELDKDIDEFLHFKDSVLIETREGELASEDCEELYNHFSNAVQSVIDADSILAVHMVDLDFRSNYLVLELIYGKAEARTRGIGDPNFLTGESHYAFDLINWNAGPTPSPGPDNSAIHIQSKLRLRYNILYLPAGSYWTSVTLWQPQSNGGGIGITTVYYSQICSGVDFKLWGSPGIEACYKGITETTMLGHTYLNFVLDEADNRISYLPAPFGKQVSHIEYWVGHWGGLQNQSNATPCLGQWEYSSAFRWKYGILVTDR